MRNILVKSGNITEVIKAEDNENKAVIGLFICNTSSSVEGEFDIFIVPKGSTPPVYDDNGEVDNQHKQQYFVKSIKLGKNDTFLLNIEKLLLHPDDSIYVGNTGGSDLAVNISFEVY